MVKKEFREEESMTDQVRKNYESSGRIVAQRNDFDGFVTECRRIVQDETASEAWRMHTLFFYTSAYWAEIERIHRQTDQ